MFFFLLNRLPDWREQWRDKMYLRDWSWTTVECRLFKSADYLSIGALSVPKLQVTYWCQLFVYLWRHNNPLPKEYSALALPGDVCWHQWLHAPLATSRPVVGRNFHKVGTSRPRAPGANLGFHGRKVSTLNVPIKLLPTIINKSWGL